MNKLLSSVFTAALVVASSCTFAQGKGQFSGMSPHSRGNVHGPSKTAPVGSLRTTDVGRSQHHMTAQAFNKPSTNVSIRNESRVYVQDRYAITAVVVLASLDNRLEDQRILRTSAPTKSAAVTRMREMIDAIGVPVNILDIELTPL